MPTIEIQALDTLFFRDGRPFEMGDDNWAEGIFPPPPSVIYGALRSAYFAQHPEDLSKANTNEDPTKKLRITGIYFHYEGQTFTVLPIDYVYRLKKHSRIKQREKKENKYEVHHLKLIENNFYSNYRLQCIPYFMEHVENLDSGILAISDFNNYLSGAVKNFYAKKISGILRTESKIGIGRNNVSNNVDVGKLYRVGMLRLSNLKNQKEIHFKIIVDYQIGDLEFKPKFLKLGAENKIVAITSLNKKFDKKILIDNYFKLVLNTPAIFEKGWKPNFPEKLNLKLIAAFVGKPIAIGGYDIKEKEPKTMYRVVPAGSVYYYKIEGNNLEEVKEYFESLNSVSTKYTQEGFGLFSIGKINSEIIKNCEL